MLCGGLGGVGLVVLTFNQHFAPIRTLARGRFKCFFGVQDLHYLHWRFVGLLVARPSMDPVLGLNILDFPH